jgi:hypothetical protein
MEIARGRALTKSLIVDHKRGTMGGAESSHAESKDTDFISRLWHDIDKGVCKSCHSENRRRNKQPPDHKKHSHKAPDASPTSGAESTPSIHSPRYRAMLLSREMNYQGAHYTAVGTVESTGGHHVRWTDNELALLEVAVDVVSVSRGVPPPRYLELSACYSNGRFNSEKDRDFWLRVANKVDTRNGEECFFKYKELHGSDVVRFANKGHPAAHKAHRHSAHDDELSGPNTPTSARRARRHESSAF